jgi:hypothetical protein
VMQGMLDMAKAVRDEQTRDLPQTELNVTGGMLSWGDNDGKMFFDAMLKPFASKLPDFRCVRPSVRLSACLSVCLSSTHLLRISDG